MSNNRINLLKKRFQLELQELQDQNLNNARRAWNLLKQRNKQTKQVIDAQIETVQQRVQNCSAKVKLQIAGLKENNKRLKTRSDALKKEISKLQEKREISVDSSKEIALEVALKMKKEELEKRIKKLTNNIQSQGERSDYYQGLMCDTQRKIARYRQMEKDKQKLEKMEQERMEGVEILRQRIATEQEKLKADLEMLEQLRNEMLNKRPSKGKRSKSNKLSSPLSFSKESSSPSPKRVNAKDAYKQILIQANIIGADQPMPIVGLDDNDDEQLDDFTLPSEYSDEDYSSNDPERVAISTLEKNILKLMSTGMYREDDPVIVDMVKQLEELRANSQ